jgi:hypothetical protein
LTHGPPCAFVIRVRLLAGELGYPRDPLHSTLRL